MGKSSKEISLEEKISFLENLFLKKGYPSETLKKGICLSFHYQGYSFFISLPLLIKDTFQTLLVVDLKLKPSLISFERGSLALARLLFKPLPYFILLTNLNYYHLIEVSSGQSLRGSEEIIPEYSLIKTYIPSNLKPFKRELEERILAIYLSDG